MKPKHVDRCFFAVEVAQVQKIMTMRLSRQIWFVLCGASQPSCTMNYMVRALEDERPQYNERHDKVIYVESNSPTRHIPQTLLLLTTTN